MPVPRVLKVTLTRNNLAEGEKAQPVYAPKYPLFADEGWWVLVGDQSRKSIFSFERITDGGRVVSKEVRSRAARLNVMGPKCLVTEAVEEFRCTVR